MSEQTELITGQLSELAVPLTSQTKLKIVAGIIALLVWIGFIVAGKASPDPLVTACQMFVTGLVSHLVTKGTP